jgi:hypothetical protein
MAFEIGSASNLEDLFTKIVEFLTTDTALVAAGQEWEVLRIHRDNLAGFTTNMTEPTAVPHRKSFHTYRYDSRSLNTDTEFTTRTSYFASTFVAGTSNVTWRLRSFKEVKKVRLRAPVWDSALTFALRDFKLQYSDNGTSWTTALTQTSTPALSLAEWRDYSVPGTPGVHEYWRVICDSSNSGTTIGWSALLLLDSTDEVVNHFGSEVILKAGGNAGTDEIFTGIRSEYDSAAGWYNLFLNGYTGFDVNETSWFKQPGALPGFGAANPYAVPMVPCWDSTMPYWFVASGRSFRMAVKVSTSYEGGYLGFILPYATPNQYPYPLLVGGSMVPFADPRSAEWRYSFATPRHSNYSMPGSSSVPTSVSAWATTYLRSVDGTWLQFGNRPNSTTGVDSINSPSASTTEPYAGSGSWRSIWPHCVNEQWTTGKRPYRECAGGGYIVQPCILVQWVPYEAVVGELEGTYQISGYANSSENTTTVNGVDHIILQNGTRTSVHEFWTLSLNA